MIYMKSNGRNFDTVELFSGASMVSKIFEKTLTENLEYVILKEMIQSLEIAKEYSSYGMAFHAGKNALLNLSAGLSVFSENVRKLDIPELDVNIVHINNENLSEQDQEEETKASEKILSEILLPESKKIITPESPIITVAPINDEVLRFLKDNPEEWFNLDGTQFQIVMQEIYTRLGYKVEATKLTRDGGKDLIIRKRELIGDFVYYVECKKYAPNRPIGVGIVREFKCTIDLDKVNGGIIATTSRFSKDARDFILGYDIGYQVQMHDGSKIKGFLNQVC